MTRADELTPAEAAVLTSLVGVPYVPKGRNIAGADCWGIVLLGALRLWGTVLPEYFYTRDELLRDAADLIEAETTCIGSRWCEVPAPYPRAAVHIFRIQGGKTHCGLQLAGDLFLHSLPGRNSCIELLTDVQWRQRRTGTYVLR